MIELRRFGGLGIIAGLAVALAVAHGCSSDSEGDDSSDKQDASADAPDKDVNVDCLPAASDCETGADCCSARCDADLGVCVEPLTECNEPGDACENTVDCCSGTCIGGTCGADQCTNDGNPCGADGECCSATCGSDGNCVALNTECKVAGNDCSSHGDCCSKFCDGGRCARSPSFCVQTGDICTNDGECCVGICTVASGANAGVCTEPDAPGSTGCLAAGEVCGDGATATGTQPSCGGECCSRSCAPYGPTGVLVCQPPSGCRPTGELCREDTDCCGGPGVPGGNGSVRCSKTAGQPVGRCDNGGSCRAAGAICKLATTSCNAENNCCAGNVNTDPSVCQQDLLGIPRCTGVGECTDDPATYQGRECATSADCCGLPCVPNLNPDAGADFICGDSCAPEGAACTTDADCCAGLPCVLEPGATSGTCGEKPDAGVDAGPDCALYGQECTVSGDCCNEIPCTDGRCQYVPQ